MNKERVRGIISISCCTCAVLVLMLAVYPMDKAMAGMSQGPVPGLSFVLDEGAGKLDIVENMLSGLYIPRPTGEEFNRILLRNRSDMEAVLSENPFLVWETLNLFVGAMPYLKEVEKNGGRLFLDRDTYSKIVSLLEKYQAVASPRLAADLLLLKGMFDSRIKSLDSEGMWIDLN